MGYEEALVAAGARVLAFENFGDYQGRWVAKVEHDGEIKWISDYYGSCSGCDAFEAEFDYYSRDKEDFQKRLSEFGMTYLEDAQSFESILERFTTASEWDMNAAGAVKWMNNNR